MAAVPNVLHIEQRVKFLFGKFRYTDVGVLDRTHLRFFDHFSIDDLIRCSGYRIRLSQSKGWAPLRENSMEAKEVRKTRRFVGGERRARSVRLAVRFTCGADTRNPGKSIRRAVSVTLPAAFQRSDCRSSL